VNSGQHPGTVTCTPSMYMLTPTVQSANSLPGARRQALYPVPTLHTPLHDTRNVALMAPAYKILDADSPTLKRAFTAPNSSFPSKKPEHTFTHGSDRLSVLPRPAARSQRLASSPRLPRHSMVQTNPRSFMPMPSFGAVFGGELHNTDAQDKQDVHGSNVVRPASSGPTVNGATFSSFHMHTDSRDSNSTTSSDNSPTTTISTMDSSSVTDPSPGVSPESPLAKTAAHSSFVADFRSRRPETSSGDASPSNFFELQRPTTPAKKARNLKNLGINTTTSLTNLRAQTPAPVGVVNKEKNSSAPPSPLFIKPPTPPKRRPSNLSLTISTPGCTENKPARLLIPSTPSFNRPVLRHFQSSPSLPLCPPSYGPANGMSLPPLRPLATKVSGLAEVPFEMEEEDDQEQNFDIPQSREEKPAAYPNGPICIYEAGVYLYFEPTAEQACTFDVIINVASEVKNPFNSTTPESQKDIDARRIDGPPAESVDFAALSQRAKPTSFGKPESPTTPRATAVMQTIQPRELVIDGKTYKTPEYIHMPWEHNTDIVPDLYKLVKIMDERLQQGKRVLIHCQCGVSRSASLIVAYGLYKDPQMSVQDAYDRAKKRSKWIGPNMNLIMQLQEFRNGLLRANDSRNQGFGRRSAGLNTSRSTGTNRYSSFERDTGSGSRTPRTAPLPPDSDMTMQRASTGNMMAISPGPLSAPTGVFSTDFRRSWDASQTHFNLSSQPTPIIPFVDPAGHVVPVLSINAAELPSPPAEVTLTVDAAEPHQLSTLELPAVPNFSRQLPLRAHETSSNVSSSFLSVGQPAGLLPLSLGALRSPAVASFNLSSSFAPRQHTESSDMMSPIKTTFDNPWPSGYDSEPQSLDLTLQDRDRTSLPPLVSPRSSEFHMTGLDNVGIDESYHMLSPRTTSFDLSGPSHPPVFGSSFGSFQPSDIASPIKTQFPKDVFGTSDDSDDRDMLSPRGEEFHMAPLKPEVAADEDPFGLTSPTRFEVAGNPFEMPTFAITQESESEDRRPSFQAILPPSHQTFNGFASLDGTAQASQHEPLTLQTLGLKDIAASTRIDSLSTSPETKAAPPAVAHTPIHQFFPKAPEPPQSPKEVFLSTPAKGIRTRFSSPNLRDQRKLHKLQTEMESKLPNKSPTPQHAVDDLDALMSPRAEEFTRNPFHFDLVVSSDDNSPVSSNETIKDGRNSHDWSEPVPRQWTPEKATVDPRSPVQTGGSPITRSIWDVL
jgi:tyrosine-protein phosphatase